MKLFTKLILGTFLLTSNVWAAGSGEGIKGYVIGPVKTDTYFVFEAQVTGDNCNKFFIGVDLKLISSHEATGKRTYKVEVSTGSTVMACEDMHDVPLIVNSEIYKVPAGDEVKFIVPSWVTVRKVVK